MKTNQGNRNNLFLKIELFLWVVVAILGLTSVILLALWFLIPLPSNNDIASNEPTPTQPIDDVSSKESMPAQSVNDVVNDQPTPTQSIEDVTSSEPTPIQQASKIINNQPTSTPPSEEVANNEPKVSRPMWWWDDDFFYRQPLILSAASTIAYDPTITQVVKLTLHTTKDTQNIFTESKAYPEGKDLRVVYWDGFNWTNLPLDVQVDLEPDKALTTTVSFPLRSVITETTRGYWLYYGNVVPGPPPVWLEDYAYAEEPSTLVEGVESDENLYVDFTPEQVTGLAPFTVTMIYGAYPEPDEYKWDFDDGETLSLPGRTDVVRFPLASQTVSTITHTYHQPGIYTPTLTAITNTVSGPISFTQIYPALIWVAGLDISDKVSVDLSGEEETPVITTTLSANPDTTHVITSAESIITVTFPPGSLKETLVVSYVPYRAIVPQGDGKLARFSITAETLEGQPVAQPEQPLIMTLDLNPFFDLSDAEARAKAQTIGFFGWEEKTENWELLKSVAYDIDQGIIAFELDRFDRSVLVFVTAMPGGPPPP